MPVTVAVDAMGGDHGPSVTVIAAARFVKAHADAEVILVGREADLAAPLARVPQRWRAQLRLHAASEVVDMDEPPADALRRKKDSSMRVAINLVRDGTAHACVSAGNTGALMAIARFVLKTLPGIDRPAIASQLPTRTGQTTVLDKARAKFNNLLAAQKKLTHYNATYKPPATSAASSSPPTT